MEKYIEEEVTRRTAGRKELQNKIIALQQEIDFLKRDNKEQGKQLLELTKKYWSKYEIK